MQESKLNYGEVAGKVKAILVPRIALIGSTYQIFLHPHGLEQEKIQVLG